MVTTTPTGIEVHDCDECGHRHPATRAHCPGCGLASLFGHQDCDADPTRTAEARAKTFAAINPTPTD